MGITEFLATYLVALINTAGYWGILLLMTLESMVFPVPSEAVMPPAGLLVAQGQFDFVFVIIIATLGSLIGSTLSYLIGKYGGRPLIDKYGKYVLLNHEDLNKSDSFFKKYGDITIFVSRFIPVIRHLISIPAGIGQMKFWKFTIYTVIGAGLWNSFLLYIGWRWGQLGWDILMEYSRVFDIIVIAILILLIIWFIKKHLKNKK